MCSSQEETWAILVTSSGATTWHSSVATTWVSRVVVRLLGAAHSVSLECTFLAGAISKE